MASDLKFHSSKLSFLSGLNPPCSNLVMPFKSSLLVTTPPPQSLCLSLPLNSLTCDLMGSIFPPPNSSCQSSTSISSLTLSSYDSDPPSSTPPGSPKHPPPYSPSTVVTIDLEPSAPQEPTLPALPSAPATPPPFSSPSVSNTHSHTSSQSCLAHLYPLREGGGRS
jgi:hypothetical protein